MPANKNAVADQQKRLNVKITTPVIRKTTIDIAGIKKSVARRRQN